MTNIITVILEHLDIKHTRTFVTKMCASNIHGNDLFGTVRLLKVFGVESHAVKIDEDDVFKELNLPYICSLDDNGFVLVTGQNDAGLVYTDGKTETKSDWDSFLKRSQKVAVMLSAGAGASEPGYKEHRKKELFQNLMWLIPGAWIVWLIVMQLSGTGVADASLPSLIFRLAATTMSTIGLFLCILLHRQWTGDGNAVEKVCSHFKTSNCSAAHDSFFFNRWFDLSEVGASYFLSIILIVLVTPQKAWSVAWLILPALPASLWNLGYQFFKQKHWCPLCVSVQILFWLIALAFLLCGAYSITTFSLRDVISAILLWGTLLVVFLKAVTPAVQNRHKAEAAQMKLSSIKGDKDVEKTLLGNIEGKIRDITIAISPTCPYCKTALETIETILMPTGRFTLEKKYKPIHKGDEEKIQEIVGKEEAQKQQEWCDEHEVNATPAIFINGSPLNGFYSVEDLLYL